MSLWALLMYLPCRAFALLLRHWHQRQVITEYKFIESHACCSVVPDTNPPVVNVVGTLCTSTVAGLPCNWTLTAQVRRFLSFNSRSDVLQLDFSGYTPFNYTLTSFVDDAGDSYSLKYPLKVFPRFDLFSPRLTFEVAQCC